MRLDCTKHFKQPIAHMHVGGAGAQLLSHWPSKSPVGPKSSAHATRPPATNEVVAFRAFVDTGGRGDRGLPHAVEPRVRTPYTARSPCKFVA